MGQVVIGVFERSADAERARAELLACGFRNEQVDVQARAARSHEPASVSEQLRDEQPASGVGGAFSKLFGLDTAADGAAHATAHAATDRRGRCSVAVHLDRDQQSSAAQDAMQRCGATEIRRSPAAVAQ